MTVNHKIYLWYHWKKNSRMLAFWIIKVERHFNTTSQSRLNISWLNLHKSILLPDVLLCQGGIHFEMWAVVILHGFGSICSWRKFCLSMCMFYAVPLYSPSNKKRWDFAFVCYNTTVPVRKPAFKYAWLEIKNYKKKLIYLLKHWISPW